MDNEKRKQEMEGHKLDHDTYKHLTTLSTGTILILATFMEKFFQQPKWRILIGAIFVNLMISVLASVIAMFCISYDMAEGGETSELSPRFQGVIVLLSCGGFLLGIMSFVAFALRNFF